MFLIFLLEIDESDREAVIQRPRDLARNEADILDFEFEDFIILDFEIDIDGRATRRNVECLAGSFAIA